MKAITLAEPKLLQTIEIDEPDAPGPGQALVRTHRMGICGTDYSCYLGKFPFFDYPRIPGHELGVEVLAVGEGVDCVTVGQRCSVEPYMNCGECYACQKGSTNCCESLKVIGVMEDGGLRERFLIRADKLHASGKLTMEQLALVETLGIGCHAADRGAPCAGDQVLVIGAGPIGLATIEFARLTGASITVMDMDPSRLEFCADTYQTKTILVGGVGNVADEVKKVTSGDGFAVVFDATGNHHSMVGAIDHVAHTGRLVFVGITTTELSIYQPAIHRRELTILSSRNALSSDFRRIITLIEDGTISTDPWITHRVGFGEVIGEFDSFTRPDSGVIKAIIEVT